MRLPLKVLSVIEATTVTGPAKNLLKLATLMRSPRFSVDGTPQVDVSIVTFDRKVLEPRGHGLESGYCPTSAGGSPMLNDGENSPNAFVAAARDAGVEIEVIPERFRFDTRVFGELRAIVDRRAPDIIQTHGVKSHFLLKVSGLSREHSWVAYHHGYTATDLKMRAYNQLDRWSLPSADRVITVCGEFAKQLAQSGVARERLHVRHNSVVPPRDVTSDERQRLRDRFGLNGDQQVVLSVGRLSREKGHADLIHAVSLLSSLDSELKFKLLIVGEGPELLPLQRAVTERGLDRHVIFVGHVSDVAPYYAIAEVMALPSHSEGSPNVLLEAMAAGLPIVATSVGGVPELATSGENALLVPPREPQLFAEALHRILTQHDLAQTLKANAIARAADFTPASHAKALIRIYEQLSSESRHVVIAPGSDTQPCFYDPVAVPRPRHSDSST